MDAKGKDYEKRRKEVEEYVQEQFDAQRKAVQIVERLTDVPVDEDFFKNCAKFILPAHFSDVIEERSILKNCGYPLCEKKLGILPQQRYHISTKANKVYDISERKCFCSQFCYRAAKYYQAQIPISPLWSRSKEKFDEINLLEANSTLPSQEEAPNDLIVRLRIKPEEIEKPSEYRERGDMDNIDDVIDDMSILSLYDSKGQRRRYNEFEKKVGKEGNKPSLESDFSKDVGENEPHLDKQHLQQEEGKGPESKRNVDMQSFPKNEEQHRSSQKNDDRNPYKTNSLNATNPVNHKSQSVTVGRSRSQGGGYVVFSHVRQCLLEWVTAESRSFLNRVEASGQANCNKMGNVMCHSDINKETVSPGEGSKPDGGRVEEVDVVSHSSSLEEDSRNEGGVVSYAASKPLPNIEQLRGDTELFTLKVTQFYSLRPDKIHPSVAEKEKMVKKKSGEKKEEDNSSNISLPPVDSTSQIVIRRKILLDKVHKILKDLLPPLGVSLREISSDLRDLVKTFDLGSHNISFKPAGWTLVSLCLLNLLAFRQKDLEDKLSTVHASRFLDVIWRQYELSNKDVKTLIHQISCSSDMKQDISQGSV